MRVGDPSPVIQRAAMRRPLGRKPVATFNQKVVLPLLGLAGNKETVIGGRPVGVDHLSEIARQPQIDKEKKQ